MSPLHRLTTAPDAFATLRTVLAFTLRETLRRRWLWAYGLFFLLATEGLFRLGGDADRVMLSVMNVVLLVVPLAGLLLGTLFYYQARPFVVLLLSQPVGRPALYAGMLAGLTLPLALAPMVGLGLPLLLRLAGGGGDAGTMLLLLAAAGLLTASAVAVAFAAATWFDDRLHGLAAVLGGWLAAAVLYDAVVLLAAQAFVHYPLERALLGAVLLNPIDLARVLLLLRFDAAALMGYTGAVFEAFFGGGWGMGLAVAALLAWCLLPTLAGMRLFRKKAL